MVCFSLVYFHQHHQQGILEPFCKYGNSGFSSPQLFYMRPSLGLLFYTILCMIRNNPPHVFQKIQIPNKQHFCRNRPTAKCQLSWTNSVLGTCFFIFFKYSKYFSLALSGNYKHFTKPENSKQQTTQSPSRRSLKEAPVVRPLPLFIHQ